MAHLPCHLLFLNESKELICSILVTNLGFNKFVHAFLELGGWYHSKSVIICLLFLFFTANLACFCHQIQISGLAHDVNFLCLSCPSDQVVFLRKCNLGIECTILNWNELQVDIAKCLLLIVVVIVFVLGLCLGGSCIVEVKSDDPRPIYLPCSIFLVRVLYDLTCEKLKVFRYLSTNNQPNTTSFTISLDHAEHWILIKDFYFGKRSR